MQASSSQVAEMGFELKSWDLEALDLLVSSGRVNLPLFQIYPLQGCWAVPDTVDVLMVIIIVPPSCLHTVSVPFGPFCSRTFHGSVVPSG